jgi:hypothetical protein
MRLLINCLVCLAIAIPVGLWLGHIGRGQFVAISISNASVPASRPSETSLSDVLKRWAARFHGRRTDAT